MKEISIDLLKKYNVQGPRYTSYPPAPSWSDSVGPKDYESILRESNLPAGAGSVGLPLSLYFHLPFCEKLCYFCGCTTVITGKNRSFEQPYLESLLKEISWVGPKIDRKRKVVQLHLGGGTPTYQSPEDLTRLINAVKENFSFDPDIEMGVEVDPRVTTVEHLKTLRKLGFNRLSMGVQDFDPTVQTAINRVQPFEDTKNLVNEARKLGFQSINMDLIYGLPHQTLNSFNKTVDQVLSIGPDRLAIYSYAHVPWMKKHQEILAPHLPQEKEKFEIFLLAMKRFTEAGFDYIGMDHFAKPNDELSQARAKHSLWRNFQGYTTKAGTDLIGFGMSAIGQINGCFAQNQRELKPYQEAINAGGPATLRGFKLSKDDRVRARLIQNLMCHAVVLKSDIEKEFDVSFDSYFSAPLKALDALAADGLVEISKKEIKPTALGRIFLRNLAMPFDAYLPKEGEKKMFSKTV